MSERGDDIHVPIKPPSKQVRSGDATAATGGASPLFGRPASLYQPDSVSHGNNNNGSYNPHAVSLTPSLLTPASSTHPVRASEVVVLAGDPDQEQPQSTQPPSTITQPPVYSPSEHQSSYVINLDRAAGGDHGSADDVNAVPLRLATRIGSQKHPWHYGLFTCCAEMNSCLESCCCTSCQASRQCNLVLNGKREIHWPICLVSFFFSGSAYTSSLVQCFIVGQLRQMVRQRYAVSGSTISDFCYAWCCTVCALQQMLLEMTVMDDFPGATCYQAITSAPPIVEMV